MKVGSLFSGIGGFDLGLERAGMEIIWQVEIDPFCNKVLAKHWPNVKRFLDVKTVGSKELEPVDLICGGFPCQPFSCAGKRMGAEDDRALWPEMLRIIQEVRPRWIIGENVAGIIGMELGNYISDLEREGYSVQAFVIPACAVNAPHRRDRVWICAHSVNCEHGTGRGQTRETDGIQGIDRPSLCTGRIERTDCHAAGTQKPKCEQSSGTRTGREGFTNGGEFIADTESKQAFATEPRRFHAEPCGKDSDIADTHDEGLQGCKETGNVSLDGQESRNEHIGRCADWSEPWPEVATRLCRVDDGLSGRMDSSGRISGEPTTKNKTAAGRIHRLKALGNSVVPQIVEIIGRAIMEIENA